MLNMIPPQTGLFAMFFLCPVIYFVIRNFNRCPGVLPPGPRPLPLIGNLFDMPASHGYLKFTEWRKTYGDVVSVSLLGRRIIVLNSLKVAIDLLHNRGSIYSNRPYMPLTGRFIGWEKALTFMSLGPESRDARRRLHQFIGSRGQLIRFGGLQMQELQKMLRRMIHDPANFTDHIRRTTGAIILKITYGYDVQEGRDELVDLVTRAVGAMSIASEPGAFLVDSFPSLRFVPSWFPGAGWKRKAIQWRNDFVQMCDLPFEMAKSPVTIPAQADAIDFVRQNLRMIKSVEDEHRVKMAAAVLYAGGADTTVSAISTFFLAMTLYPNTQKKAQDEIDAVIGPDRLPTLDDMDNLPYINALCSEVLRWQPVGPLSVPHSTAEDDYYNGYFVPKDTTIVGNIWAMLRDPETYSNPDIFRPERFLPIHGSSPELDPRAAIFGFGRRICPGRYMVDALMFQACAMTLATLDISKAIEDGCEITPQLKYHNGSIRHPEPFKFSTKPRSTRSEALILAEDVLY